MLARWQFWFLTAASTLVLVVVVANMLLFDANARMQARLNERQLYVQQSVQLEGLYREMVKALAELSVQKNDERLKALLAAQGITFNVNATAPNAGPATAPTAKGR